MAFWFVVSTVKTSNRTSRQRMTPFLWFKDPSEEAAAFHVAIFKVSAINPGGFLP
jgi:hypothetical protein